MNPKYHLILFIILSLFCLIFIGCGPSTTSKPEKPNLYSQEGSPQIMWTLRRDNGIDANAMVFPDKYYIVVDEEWFKQKIMPGFQEFLFKNGIENYNKLKNDCDDFARSFSFYVRIKFRTMGYMESSPAVGDLHYSNLDVGHAINVGVFYEKNTTNKVVRFIEPQFPPRFVDLDEETKKYYVNYIGM